MATVLGRFLRLRRSALGLNTQPSTLTRFGYDNAGRLAGVTNGNYHAAYSYLANSPLVGQITFKENTRIRMTTTKAYDKLHPVRWRVRSLPRLRKAADCLAGNPWHNRLSHGVNRLTRIASSGAGVSPASSFEYFFNSANQCLRRESAARGRWGWIAERLWMGTPGHVNHLLYRARQGRKAKGKRKGI